MITPSCRHFAAASRLPPGGSTLTHSFTHSLIHSFTHSLIHSFTHSLSHQLSNSLIPDGSIVAARIGAAFQLSVFPLQNAIHPANGVLLLFNQFSSLLQKSDGGGRKGVL